MKNKHIRNSLQILALTMGVSLTATAIAGDNQKHSKKVSIANELSDGRSCLPWSTFISHKVWREFTRSLCPKSGE